ncbi:MAG: thioredoxin family protein [Rhodobacterales bacterium]|nr:MAG: thioredoxin family protein [Rhodobacterales bacterium]
MIDVKVYGPGCKRCDTTARMLRDTAAELGLEANVQKVTDYAQIAMAGVVSTPGVAINGTLVHSGGLPDTAAVRDWLLTA